MIFEELSAHGFIRHLSMPTTGCMRLWSGHRKGSSPVANVMREGRAFPQPNCRFDEKRSPYNRGISNAVKFGAEADARVSLGEQLPA
jgi:hypothetical protein